MPICSPYVSSFCYTFIVLTPVSITAFYAFLPFTQEQLQVIQSDLKQFGADHHMRGLVLLAPEGINGTVSGSDEVITQWKEHLTEKFGRIIFKDSSADHEVFRRFFVKLKPEIVCFKDENIQPQGSHKHLIPEEFHRVLQEEDVVILDARNDYEVAIGKFENAVDPKIRRFHEFPEYVKQSGIPKDKKVLMYCTGGIRCEKALIAMEQQGYENVYQLEGGILAYLQKFPEGKFKGECFVFDHRVAVDQHLQPSQVYGLCPHCGDPGDLQITCSCGKTQKVCALCSRNETKKTCSKRCANEAAKRMLVS